MIFNAESRSPQKQLPAIRHDWTQDEVLAILRLPFADLIYQAQTIHRAHFDPNEVQVSTLLSIKTGGCPEDCAYCPQSARYKTGLKSEPLMAKEAVLAEAESEGSRCLAFLHGGRLRAQGQRGRRGRGDRQRRQVARARNVRDPRHAHTRTSRPPRQAGLDYYNHNLDTSESFYGQIISTRTYQDRLDTLAHVREAGMHVCCGGILGMGEGLEDRAAMLRTLANLPEHPESVPINLLVKVEGTPLSAARAIDPLDFVRTVAAARILMPASVVRLSAGRDAMSDELQALCFLAGANSIFYGEKLLTTPNPEADADRQLFNRLGLRPMVPRAEPERFE